MPNLIYKEMMVKCPHCKLDRFAYAPSREPRVSTLPSNPKESYTEAAHSHARFYICLNCGNIIMFGTAPDNQEEWE